MAALKKREFDYLFKLVVIGDSGVGKSCLLLRFSDDSFSESHIATIGVDFRFKTIEIEHKKVKLQIWDTAGQDRFRTVNPAFYRGSDGIVLVYDVTQLETFNRIEGWYREAVEYAKEDSQKILIANKADLEPRQVSEQLGRELAVRLGNIPFIETSAKTATNVESAFLTIAADLVRLNASRPVVRPAENAKRSAVAVDGSSETTGATGGGNSGCPCS